MTKRTAFLAAITAAALFLCGAVDPTDPIAQAGIDQRPGASIPLDGRFLDATGKAVTLRQLAGGKPLILVPVQHQCPNICGVTLAGLADAIDGQARLQPGRDFGVVALGIDPREGPSQAADDLRRFKAQRPNTRWLPAALTGTEAKIHEVTDTLGYRYVWSPALRQYAHASGSAVISPEGRLTTWLYGLAPTPDELSRALDEAQSGSNSEVMQRLLLLCFHYDPQSGRYSMAIGRVLRIAGLATVAGMALAIVWLSRWRRT